MKRVATICRPRMVSAVRCRPGESLVFMANSIPWSGTKKHRGANAGFLSMNSHASLVLRTMHSGELQASFLLACNPYLR